MKASETKQIVELIKELLQSGGSHYFNVEVSEDIDVKIRVSDHSANRHNNNERPTLSFITKRSDQGYRAMDSEWVVDDLEYMYTDTYESVAEILEWEFSEAK